MSIMRSRETFSPAQCRAARGLLDWSSDELARRAGVEPEAVELYERQEADLGDADRAALGRAFVDCGVIAKASGDGGEGVRFARPASHRAGIGSAFLMGAALTDEPGSYEDAA